MLAPASAIRPATAAIALARSGVPMIVTWERPSPRDLLSPTPWSTSTLIPSEDAVCSTAVLTRATLRGAVTSTPRISRPRSTICSMSRTSMPAPASAANTEDVTPGRSLPVSVIRRVSGFTPARGSVISVPEAIGATHDVGVCVHAGAMTSAQTLTAFAGLIDARDWDGLAELLSPDFTALFVHTGETFDRYGFVTLNRDYPIVVRFEVEDLVATGD